MHPKETDLSMIPRTEKKGADALGFIPKPIRNMVMNLLCKELKKNNIESMILIFDKNKTGEEAFTADFFPDNIQEKILAMELENRQLKHKISFLQNKQLPGDQNIDLTPLNNPNKK